MSLEEALSTIRERIAKARRSSPLSAKQLTIIGASKQQPVALIECAIAAGMTDFGENRVQEAYDKWPEIKHRHSHVRLHLIGPLQSNKAREAVALFDVIQSVDRNSLVDALAKEMQKQGREVPCFIQLNTGEEAQKSGVIPADADALIAYARAQGLKVEGLMCVPPVEMPPAPHFALLHEIAKRNGLEKLSMGMSEDYAEAVRLGATHVRIGRALFGERV